MSPNPTNPTQDFDKCDFTAIRLHLDRLREEKKEMPKEAKDKAKLEKEALQRKFGFALLDDNRIEKVG
jgi:DNA topoisomerase-1